MLHYYWHTFWHTVGGFEFYEIRKSLAVQGFLVLVIAKWFHRWEFRKMRGISCDNL
jgi:hypothetical protein